MKPLLAFLLIACSVVLPLPSRAQESKQYAIAVQVVQDMTEKGPARSFPDHSARVRPWLN